MKMDKDEKKDAIGRYEKIKMRGQYSFPFEKYLHFKKRGKEEMVSKYTTKLMILESVYPWTDRQTDRHTKTGRHSHTHSKADT